MIFLILLCVDLVDAVHGKCLFGVDIDLFAGVVLETLLL